jgi:hypothetical protein
MSGSPRPPGSFDEELLFPDDITPVLPARPATLPKPIAKRSSAVAPIKPSAPPPKNSTVAFAIRPGSTIGYSLPRKPTPARTQGPYMPGGRRRTKKAGRRRKAGRTARGSPKSRRRRV